MSEQISERDLIARWLLSEAEKSRQAYADGAKTFYFNRALYYEQAADLILCGEHLKDNEHE